MNPPQRHRLVSYGRLAIFGVAGLAAMKLTAADQFGDMSVSAAAMYTGSTYHGYGAMQVTLENHSADHSHVVSLSFPNNNWDNGNSIGRLGRTVTVEPEAREVILLMQPPLPMSGDGNIRVEVDNHHEGEVHAPNANNHCNSYSGRGGEATVFVSRTLNFDSVEHVFNSQQGGFTAAMAVGAPDAPGYGIQPSTWMPDARAGSMTNWLELDYATPQIINQVTIRCTQSPVTSGQVVLLGMTGTNIASLPMSTGVRGSASSGWTQRFTFPDTAEPVKTVRLEFGKTAPFKIAIDAVEITGATNSQWAVDARASSDNSAQAAAYSGSSPGDTIQSLRAESPVGEWSEDWLAYSPFDAMVVSESDMNSMTPAVQTAIGDYLQAGGTVILPGKNDLPAAWHAFKAVKLRDGNEYSVGLGRCFTLPEDPASFDSKTVETLRQVARDSAHYWQSLPDEDGAANSTMPVVNNLKYPARGIVIIMVAFIIIIGPVNLIYLNRRNRRTWMLWTIPAISLATTLLVFVYSLLREGITPDTRIAGFTLIDQNSHHEATVGGTAFYCPLTPSGGLNFEYETEATPLVRTGYGNGVSREVDWTQSQHFSHGWVSARVPAHFLVRKSGTGRERIQVINENGKLGIINGLGAPVKTLWYADADMNLYEAQNIAAGSQAGLIPAKSSEPLMKNGAQGLLEDIGYAAPPDSVGPPEKYLTPNTYIAVLEGNPFIENALGAAASAKRTRSSAVVFGILESPPAP